MLRYFTAGESHGKSLMGISIDVTEERINIKGMGLRGLKEPNKKLYVGNSGTIIRLISGILAGQDFQCEIAGDNSIENRLMKRIISPLKEMDGEIRSIDKEGVLTKKAMPLLKSKERD